MNVLLRRQSSLKSIHSLEKAEKSSQVTSKTPSKDVKDITLPNVDDFFTKPTDIEYFSTEELVKYNEYSLRKSFSLQQIDIGFPDSHVHKMFRLAVNSKNTEAPFDFPKILAEKNEIQITPLLLILPNSVVTCLHECMLPILLVQVICFLIICSTVSADFWLPDWKIKQAIDSSFKLIDNKSKPAFYSRFVLPFQTNLMFHLKCSWCILIFVYLPMSLLHLLYILDEKKETFEITGLKIFTPNDPETTHECEKEVSDNCLTLLDHYKSPRRFQLATLLITLFACSLFFYILYVIFYQCSYIGSSWRNEISNWIKKIMANYFNEHNQETFKTKETFWENINQLDLVQKSVGCCGLSGPNDWYKEGIIKHFTSEEISFFPDQVDSNNSVPFSCCKWAQKDLNLPHSSLTNVNCDHVSGLADDIFTRGCNSPLVHIIVENWIKPHFQLLLLVEILLIPQILLNLAAFQPQNCLHQIRGIQTKISAKRELALRVFKSIQENLSQLSSVLSKKTMQWRTKTQHEPVFVKEDETLQDFEVVTKLPLRSKSFKFEENDEFNFTTDHKINIRASRQSSEDGHKRKSYSTNQSNIKKSFLNSKRRSLFDYMANKRRKQHAYRVTYTNTIESYHPVPSTSKM